MNTLLKAFLVLYLIRNLVLAYYIDSQLCLRGSEWATPPTNFLTRLAADLMKDGDLLLMAMPPHIKIGACNHVFVLGPLYAVALLALLLSWHSVFRVVGSLAGPGIFFLMCYYIADSILGSLPSPKPWLVLISNVDYAIGGLLLWWAALSSSSSPRAASVETKEKAVNQNASYSIRLLGYPEGNKIKLLKEVRKLKPGMDIMASKKLVEEIPQIIISKLTAETLKEWTSVLDPLEAKYELVE